MKKGFTLIELLAVIVILAIIALIVAPIVLNIIDDADKNSEEKSAKLYIHAVELAIAKQNMSSRFTDATCTVNVGGNLTCGEITVPVDVNNKSEIKGGTITIQSRKITQVTNLKVGNGTYNMGSDGKLRGKIEVDSDTSEEDMKSKAMSIENVKIFTDGKEIVKVIVVPKKLVNIVVK